LKPLDKDYAASQTSLFIQLSRELIETYLMPYQPKRSFLS